MAQLGKGKLNYRCPSCFMRDLDIDMFYNRRSTVPDTLHITQEKEQSEVQSSATRVRK